MLEEHDLGILAAYVDERGNLGMTMLHVFGSSHHLLHEVITVAFGHAHSHRAREADAALGIAHHFAQLSEALGHAPLDISVVSFIVGEQRFILIVYHHGLECGGAYIQPYTKSLLHCSVHYGG